MAWSIPKILVSNYGIDVKNGIDHFEPAAMIWAILFSNAFVLFFVKHRFDLSTSFVDIFIN